MGQAHGVATVIENRPGAATVLGVEAASRAAPDGNTLGIVANSFIIHPNFKKLSYDPLTSFEPVCLLANSPQVIVVNSASPYKTLTELIDAARAKPGELSNASVGPASAQHIAIEQLKLLAKVEHDVRAVQRQHAGAERAARRPRRQRHVELFGGRRARRMPASCARSPLASANREIEAWPNVPTVAEQGFKDYAVEVWYGLVAPAKTPKDKIAELSKWCAEAMLAPELKAKWDLQGLSPVGSTSEEFATHLRQQSDDYARVIREANIKGE